MKTKSPIKAAVLLTLFPAAASVEAFDVWDFHTGMTSGQVAAVAKRQGYDDARPESTPTRWQNVWYERLTPSGTFEVGYVAGFCDGRLEYISRDYKGDMATLFELLQELRPTYGSPTVETESSVLNEGRAREVTFKFQPKVEDTASVIVNLTLGSETSFGIQVTHRNPTRCAAR